MKKITFTLFTAIISFAVCKAQNTFPASGRTGIYTTSPAASLQVRGGARIGTATNYANIDSATGNLSFAGTSAYRVGGNKYAFQFDGDPDYGLFFNQTNVRYEFRNSTAAPIFYIGANDGNSVFSGGVQIGNSSLANAGNLRWTGTDFQGYNGSTWVSLTSGGGGAETDPEVGANTTSFVPRWNGTALVAGHLQDNGSRIGINKAPETEYRFAALRQQTSGSFAATIYAAIKGENNLTNSSTINSVGYLGVNNPGGIYPFIFPDLSVADIGILGVKENSTTEGAGVFAWNRGTAVTANYGLYAAATGSAGNKYGVYAKALGTGAVNRAIYAEASGATFNYALIVPENGGNAGFGWTAPSATLGAKSNGTDDIFKIINTGFSTKFLVDAAGSVVVNASAPTTGMELSVNGDLYASSQLSVGTTSQAAEVNIYGTDETVIIDGTNPYLQINNAGAKTGYIRASGLNFQVATNAENDNGKLEFRTNGSSRMWIDASGNVSVGGSAKVATGYLFSVVGKVMAEEVRVELNGTWPDYVFASDYNLMPLQNLKQYVMQNNHLPEIPSAEEMKDGIDVGKMNKLLMQKVEELTLYIIQLNEEVQALKNQNK